MNTGMARAARPEVEGTANAVATNTPVVYSGVGRRSDEFAVVRAGLNYKFGSY